MNRFNGLIRKRYCHIFTESLFLNIISFTFNFVLNLNSMSSLKKKKPFICVLLAPDLCCMMDSNLIFNFKFIKNSFFIFLRTYLVAPIFIYIDFFFFICFLKMSYHHKLTYTIILYMIILWPLQYWRYSLFLINI